MTLRGLAALLMAAVYLAVAGVLLYGGRFAAAPVATLTVLEGKLVMQKGGSGAFAPARSGSALHPGDVIRTSADGRAAVSFDDRSVARLDRDSELALSEGGAEQRRGRGWYRPAPLGSEMRRVRAAGAAATAQEPGTELLVDAGRAGPRFDAWTGSLEVAAGGRAVQIRGDQSTRVPTGESPAHAAAIPDADRSHAFTVLNRVLDAAHGGLLGVSSGTLQKGQATAWLPLPSADGQTNVQLVLGWTTSTVQLGLESPDHKLLDPITTGVSPASIELPRAAAGTWRYKLTAGDAVPVQWVLATSWRPAAHEEADVIQAASHRLDARRSAKTLADLEKVEGGAALQDDRARLDLANRFPDGTNPVAVHWVTRDVTLQTVQPYVIRQPPRPDLAITLSRGSAAGGQVTGTLVTLFTKTGSVWKAIFESFALGDLALRAVSVDGDGYVSPLSESQQRQRYVLSAGEFASAASRYLNFGHGEDLVPDQSLKQERDDFARLQDSSGDAQSQHAEPAPQYGTYGIPLQDGGLLAIVGLRHTFALTPPAGKCLLQPSIPTPDGSFSAWIGLARGSYAALNSSSLDTYVVAVPGIGQPDHQVRVVGARGLVAPDGAQPTCGTSQQPGRVQTGAYSDV